MSAASKIEWTEATWNPVRGCAVVSPGCTNCYAMRQAHRHAGIGGAYAELTKMTKGGPVWTGEVRTYPELLDWPLRKRKPLRIFVNSMSDLFHEDVPVTFIGRVFGVMAVCSHHQFQILTKRQERMRDLLDAGGQVKYEAEQYAFELLERMRPKHLPPTHPCDFPGIEWPLPNVWLGVSVEDQRRADERIPLLLQTPAAVRWISAEPLLGPVNLRQWTLAEHGRRQIGAQPGLHWVVGGGESGPGARPFDIAWARALRDQCKAAGVPYFMKQLGANVRVGEWSDRLTVNDRVIFRDRKGGEPAEWPDDLRIREYPNA